jgi:hypothetical protein
VETKKSRTIVTVFGCAWEVVLRGWRLGWWWPDIIEVAIDMERVYREIGVVVFGEFGRGRIVDEAGAFRDKRQFGDVEGWGKDGGSVVIHGRGLRKPVWFLPWLNSESAAGLATSLTTRCRISMDVGEPRTFAAVGAAVDTAVRAA